MKTDKEPVPVEVFAGTPWEASMIKNLLENAEIEAFLKDEVIGTLAPWHAAPGGMNPVRIFVPGMDVDKALIIIKEYEENLKKQG